MIEVIDEESNLRVGIFEEESNAYYISMGGVTKMVCDKMITSDSNILLKVYPHGTCNDQDFVFIVDKFTNYICSKDSTIKGVIIESDNIELSEFGFNKLTDKKMYRGNPYHAEKVR